MDRLRCYKLVDRRRLWVTSAIPVNGRSEAHGELRWSIPNSAPGAKSGVATCPQRTGCWILAMWKRVQRDNFRD
jgi:hypothetical protein